jgi:hypothetical protein
MEKKGQVAIFIIISVLTIAGIAVFFIIRQGVIPSLTGGQEINPNSFLVACLEESVLDISKSLAIHGGDADGLLMKEIFITDEDEIAKMNYLCYNQEGSQMCNPQEPLLISFLETKIHEAIEPDVEVCLNEFKESLERQGYDVKREGDTFDIKLDLGKIIINIYTEFELTKSDETKIEKNYAIVIPSKLYDFSLIAKRIVNSESRFCDFNTAAYNLINQETKIERTSDSQGEKIYTITYRENPDFFRFAVRGCIL